MGEHVELTERFEENRNHLRAVAFRMLGSLSEADDAVQEAWLRLSRAGTSGVENRGGWLTTVVARVCLDMLRSRKSQREEPWGEHVPEPAVGREAGADPEHEAVLADVLRSDRAILPPGAPAEVRGAEAVARRAGRGGARAAQPALVNGAVGVVVAPRGKLLMVLRFTIAGGKIAGIDAVADPERLRQLDLAVLD